MIIQQARRSNVSYCRVCGRKFKRGEKYVKLNGTYRVMRSIMCMEHFHLAECGKCKEEERMKCITSQGMSICILGGEKPVNVKEYV